MNLEQQTEEQKEQGSITMRPVYRAGWYLCRAVARIYFRWRVFSPERVPPEGPLLLAANHESYLDPAVIGGAVDREIHYLAREPALRVPVWGPFLRYLNAIPINQEGGATAGLRASLDVLGAGNALVLFPEGTRTFDGELQPFRSGIGLIVARAGVPVLPIRLFGLFNSYGRHMLVPRPRRIAVKVGQPLTFDHKISEISEAPRPRLKEIYQEIADEIQAAVARLRPDDES